MKAFSSSIAVGSPYAFAKNEKYCVTLHLIRFFHKRVRGATPPGLKELTNAYLYKDVSGLSGIRNPAMLRDLVRMLAYRVGGEVSFNELGGRCGLSADTVISYIDLLEKAFVVSRLGAWSGNLRKEVSKKCKVYFIDNGVRNAVIDNFNELQFRDDPGALWENFLVAERRKRNQHSGGHGESWFWRLKTGSELDYLENTDGRMDAFEFKWGKKAARVPVAFGAAYPSYRFQLVNRENWQEFAGAAQGEPVTGLR